MAGKSWQMAKKLPEYGPEAELLTHHLRRRKVVFRLADVLETQAGEELRRPADHYQMWCNVIIERDSP
jgi:hypothetical protein